MKPRSDKMQEKYRERRKLVDRLLKERPMCETCIARGRYLDTFVIGHRESTDLHEIKNRSQGGDFLDEDQILCVCRPCHMWITENPEASEAIGAHVPGWAPYEYFSETARIRKSWEMDLPIIPMWWD